MTRTIPPWLMSDAATYDTLRARARVLERLLLQPSEPGAIPERVREELASVRASVSGVDGFRGSDVVALLDSIDSRIRELNHVNR